MTEQNANSPLGDRIDVSNKDRHIVIVGEARYPSTADKPLSLNVAKNFRDDEMRDFLMELLEKMANHKLQTIFAILLLILMLKYGAELLLNTI